MKIIIISLEIFRVFAHILNEYAKPGDGGEEEDDRLAYIPMGISITSLALPDPLLTGAYRLEIISAALRGSGTIHSPKMF